MKMMKMKQTKTENEKNQAINEGHGVFSKGYTSAGIRTRVRALATPGDDRYTTDVRS